MSTSTHPYVKNTQFHNARRIPTTSSNQRRPPRNQPQEGPENMSRKGQLDGLQLRRRLGPKQWGPPRPFGPDGWILDRRSEPESRIIISCAKHDNSDWVHASISRPNSMPTYEDLTQLHSAVFQDGYAYQVFAPRVDHVNIHPFCLHLWGRLDGAPALPIFAMNGSI